MALRRDFRDIQKVPSRMPRRSPQTKPGSPTLTKHQRVRPEDEEEAEGVHEEAAEDHGETAILCRETCCMKCIDRNGEDDEVIDHVEQDVEAEIAVAVEGGDVIEGEDLGEDGRETCRADEFDHVHGDCEDRDAEDHRWPLDHLGQMLHSFDDLLAPCVVRDLADIRVFAECLEQIEAAGAYGDCPNNLLDPEVVANDEEHVEPSCDEEVVDGTAHEEERSPNDPHFPHVVRSDEEGEEGDEHPHGAGVEPIEEAEEYGESGE